MHFRLHRPQSVEEAITLQAQTGGTYLAGGTVLLVDRRHGKAIGEDLISLENLASLREIRECEGEMIIGACATFRELERSALLRENAFALWQAAGSVGGPQVRNRGTIGGNLAAGSPSSDCAAPLLAMGACLRIRSAEGTRELPVEELFAGVGKTYLAPGELITEIVLPKKERCVSAFRKVGKRSALAISCINMAVARESAGGKETVTVAVGAAAPTPRLWKRTSEILSAGVLDEACLDEACQTILTEIAPIDDRWATAEYRRMVCVNLLKDILKETEGKVL